MISKEKIMFELFKYESVECDIETAKELEAEGFIHIESYDDGVLDAEIEWESVLYEIYGKCSETDTLILCFHNGDDFGYYDSTDIMTLKDDGFIDFCQYCGDDEWIVTLDYDSILCNLCKRWDNNLNEVA